MNIDKQFMKIIYTKLKLKKKYEENEHTKGKYTCFTYPYMERAETRR